MKRKTLFQVVVSIISLMMIGMVSAAASFSVASEEDAAFYEKIDAAISNNDYAAWKELMTSSLTKENFDKQVNFRKSMEQQRKVHEELIKAWESGDSAKVEELETQLKELAGDNYGFYGFTHAAKGGRFLKIGPGMGHGMVMASGEEGHDIGFKFIAKRNLSESEREKIEDLKKQIDTAIKEGDKAKVEKLHEQINQVLGVNGTGPFTMKVEHAKMMNPGKKSFWDAFRFW